MFSSSCRTLGIVLLILLPRITAAGDESVIEGDSRSTVTVGMEGFIKQVVLPGSELTTRDVDPRRTPVALRIDRVYPHGDSLRYDITFYGLEPGNHNLTDYLVRKDGSTTEDLPALSVTINSILPSGEVRPSKPPTGFLTRIGGYQTAMILAIVAWILGLFAILFFGRKQQAQDAHESTDQSTSEVDHIRSLIQQAMDAGELTAEQKAQLDMKVLNFWRARRNIEEESVSEALTVLKSDEQAGPLLTGLERWFYSRNAPDSAEIRGMLEDMKQHGLGEQPPVTAAGGTS